MKYGGFREEPLLSAARELEGLGLRPAEIYAILNLAGAKWRAVQIREGRGEEWQSEADRRAFHEATVALMKTTMSETRELAALGHSTEGERFMLLAISITMSGLFARGPRSVREWLRDGERRTRKVILSFAMGSCIIVDPQAIDILLNRIVKFRYGTKAEPGEDASDAILGLIERQGNSGYACLRPITDAMK